MRLALRRRRRRRAALQPPARCRRRGFNHLHTLCASLLIQIGENSKPAEPSRWKTVLYYSCRYVSYLYEGKSPETFSASALIKLSPDSSSTRADVRFISTRVFHLRASKLCAYRQELSCEKTPSDRQRPTGPHGCRSDGRSDPVEATSAWADIIHFFLLNIDGGAPCLILAPIRPRGEFPRDAAAITANGETRDARDGPILDYHHSAAHNHPFESFDVSTGD